MYKTLFIALYFLNIDGTPQVENKLFDTREECVLYMDTISAELKFWRDSGGKTDGSTKMPWITWRMSCRSFDPKWESR